MPARVLLFVSHADQLKKRGFRAYGRFKSLSSGFTARNGRVHLQWQAEEEAARRRDAEWAERHGRVPGRAAVVVPFPRELTFDEAVLEWFERKYKESQRDGSPPP